MNICVHKTICDVELDHLVIRITTRLHASVYHKAIKCTVYITPMTYFKRLCKRNLGGKVDDQHFQLIGPETPSL